MAVQSSQYRVAIVGGGPGGYVAALRCAQLGLKTVCIDERAALGGTCLNVGCIPSKTLLYSSELYSSLRQAERLGVHIAQAEMDFPVLMQHKNEVIAGLTGGVSKLLQRHGVTTLQGRASFLDAQHLSISLAAGATEQISADFIVLATGSEPIALPFAPFDEQRIVSSTGALWLPRVPESLAVIGAGAIGLELASVYSRLGTAVTVLEKLDQVCPGQESSIQQALKRVLERQGLFFQLNSSVLALDTTGSEGVEISYSHVDSQQKTIKVDVALVCVGRRPVSENLNLAAAGLSVGKGGFLAIDGHFRTSQRHIYAIGDLVAGPGLAHRASEEGLAVAQLIAGLPAHVNYMAIPNVIYTYPEAASVGMIEERARELLGDIAVGTSYFRGNARARCSNSEEGFVKIIADKASQRIIGMHILGDHASELIATGALAIAWGADLSALATTPFAHPTLSEAIKEAAMVALGQPLHH